MVPEPTLLPLHAVAVDAVALPGTGLVPRVVEVAAVPFHDRVAVAAEAQYTETERNATNFAELAGCWMVRAVVVAVAR